MTFISSTPVPRELHLFDRVDCCWLSFCYLQVEPLECMASPNTSTIASKVFNLSTFEFVFIVILSLLRVPRSPSFCFYKIIIFLFLVYAARWQKLPLSLENNGTMFINVSVNAPELPEQRHPFIYKFSRVLLARVVGRKRNLK